MFPWICCRRAFSFRLSRELGQFHGKPFQTMPITKIERRIPSRRTFGTLRCVSLLEIEMKEKGDSAGIVPIAVPKQWIISAYWTQSSIFRFALPLSSPDATAVHSTWPVGMLPFESHSRGFVTVLVLSPSFSFLLWYCLHVLRITDSCHYWSEWSCSSLYSPSFGYLSCIPVPNRNDTSVNHTTHWKGL